MTTENKGAVPKDSKDGGPRDAKEDQPRSSVREAMQKDPIRKAVNDDGATILATEAVSTASKDPGSPTNAELAEAAMQRRAERAEASTEDDDDKKPKDK